MFIIFLELKTKYKNILRDFKSFYFKLSENNHLILQTVSRKGFLKTKFEKIFKKNFIFKNKKNYKTWLLQAVYSLLKKLRKIKKDCANSS